MNARVTGSLHIYGPIAGEVVRADQAPQRTVSQHRTPAGWQPMALEEFLAAAEEAGCGYDPAGRRGVLVAMPPMPGVRGGFDFCVVHGSSTEEQDILRALDTRLRAE